MLFLLPLAGSLAGFPSFGERWTWQEDEKVDGNCLDTSEVVIRDTEGCLTTGVSSLRWILIPIPCEVSITENPLCGFMVGHKFRVLERAG